MDNPASERASLLSPAPTEHSPRFTFKPYLTCLVLNFCIEMFDMLILVLTVAVLEMALCHNYYSINNPAIIGLSGTIETQLCKTNAVQQQLAVFRSWKPFFDALSSMLQYPKFPRSLWHTKSSWQLSLWIILLISLAERRCLRAVFSDLWRVLCGRSLFVCSPVTTTLAGIILSTGKLDWIPIQLVWLSAAFNLLGNLSSANATVYTMAADSCSESDRYVALHVGRTNANLLNLSK